ncbi:hypothetical protein HDU93_006081, partial [Gonapodya sp. JEL0774]
MQSKHQLAPTASQSLLSSKGIKRQWDEVVVELSPPSKQFARGRLHRPVVLESHEVLDMVGDVSFAQLLPFSFATLPEGENWEQYVADYRAGIPLDGKPAIYRELQSLLDGRFISDSPIEALATRAINDAELPVGVPRVGYVNSFFTSVEHQRSRESLHDLWIEGHGNLELLREAELYFMPINVTNTHWYLVLYHVEFDTFLIMDSIKNPWRRYEVDLIRCRRVLNEALGKSIGRHVNVVVAK